ncbi:AraC family transcriptional regulator [Parendozoicomonas haliclonae]|uniref:HTH-type transcriptional regulator VirS n=1 Tax=Parendozoicomonas haliclonae TaxID=1960125 RepID=A0A1X7AML0_9GAMM|nr:AraC family transcriptional regulator [Parendozoicomonas haliclonae]SMA49283.1 HTH-type transcriptional regulator VirS [Parendozoicomonas haliclonae]
MNLGELSTDFLLPLLEATRQNDRNPEQVLAQYGFQEEQLQHPGQWLSIARFMRIGEALIDLTDNPGLGLEAGRLGGLTGAGLAGMAAITAPTLGDALETLTRFEPLYARNIRGSSQWHRDALQSHLCFYSIAPYNEYNRFVVDSILAGWVQLCEQLTGRSDLVEAMTIEFEAPHYVSHYTRELSCRIEFGQPQNAVILKEGAEQTRLLFASLPDHRRMVSLCQTQLESISHPLTISHKTARAIAACLPKPCTLEIIAEALKTPHWTLRRKLQEENTTFKEILEQTRKELAGSYLANTATAVSEVAYLTGFSSTEAFQRAFKRWTGLPPGEYRRQNQPVNN